MKIEGKTAIVTGGASGLGKATLCRLHQLGANVVIADMNPINGKTTVEELKERAIFIETNVTQTETVQNAVDIAGATFGSVDILVNCAGTGSAMKTVGRNGPHDLNVFKQVVDINLIGTFDFIRLAAEKMQDSEPNQDGERGVIINTASIAAYDGQIGQAAYSASKAGIIGLTLTVARDMARSGIRCCTIVPGVCETPLMLMAGEEMINGIVAHIPFPKRLGKPEEYASLAQHIIENSYMNGECIRMDGAVRFPPK